MFLTVGHFDFHFSNKKVPSSKKTNKQTIKTKNKKKKHHFGILYSRVFFSKFLMEGLKVFLSPSFPMGTKSDGGDLRNKSDWSRNCPPNAKLGHFLLLSLKVGYKWVIFCFIFATVFLYSICPISTWNDLFFGLGAKKKVRRAKIQNGRRFPWKITFSTITLSFVGLFVWFWCLTLCFWGQRFHLCS